MQFELEDVERKAQELSVSVTSSLDTSKLAADYNNALKEIQNQREANYQLNWKVEQLTKDVELASSRYEGLLKSREEERQAARQSERTVVTSEKDREIQQINFRFGAEKYELEQELAKLQEAIRTSVPPSSGQGPVF